jgi:hypothetical protein
MDANSGKSWSKMDVEDLRAIPRLWQHVRGRREHALQGRRRGPAEGEGARAGRAPKKMVTRQPGASSIMKSPAEAGR